MIKTFTQDDVVRYLYDEIPPSEKAEFESALIFNDELLRLFNDLAGVKNGLSDISKNPSNRVVENILDYANSLNLQGCKEESDSRHS